MAFVGDNVDLLHDWWHVDGIVSFLAMCDADRTYTYLQSCDLTYAIVGKAIQKICDSHVVSKENKERFKGLRARRDKGRLL